MHLQVLVDQFVERHRRRQAVRSESSELLERIQRVTASREPANLRPRRAASLQAIPVRPEGLPVNALRLQLEHLTLLDHLGTSSIDNRIEESHPRRDDDHPSH
jgi:hypothetical protein